MMDLFPGTAWSPARLRGSRCVQMHPAMVDLCASRPRAATYFSRVGAQAVGAQARRSSWSERRESERRESMTYKLLAPEKYWRALANLYTAAG